MKVILNRIDHKKNINVLKKCFLISCRRGSFEIVKMLLKTGVVDPSERSNYGICQAARYGYIDIVKLLLRYPTVDPHANGRYALEWAKKKKYPKIVELLSNHS